MNASLTKYHRATGGKSKSHLYHRITGPFILSVLVPSMALFFLFRLKPLLDLIWLSLHEWSAMLAGSTDFIGLSNYIKAFSGDPQFPLSIKNTAIYTVIKLLFTLVFGMLCALGLNKIRSSKLRSWVLTGYYAPNITSIIGSALVFKYLYDPTFGLFNHLLTRVGLPRLLWLYSPATALPSIAMMDTWKGFGFAVVIFLTGIQAIPREHYEAASIDGASSFQSFLRITIPQLWPVLGFMSITTVVNAMKAITPIYVMSSAIDNDPGGPLYSTYTLALHIFNNGFQYFRMDYACALATIMFAIMAVFIAFWLRLTNNGQQDIV